MTRGAWPLLILLIATTGCGGRGDDALGPSRQVSQAGPLAAPITTPPASPAPSPSPEASAAPQAAPEPEPAPSPDCIHATANGVVSVSLAVYFVECGGARVPGSGGATQAPVGCRIHFNATPRDGMGAPTCSRSWPVWQVGPTELVRGGGGDTFTPTYTVEATGTLSARCIVDNVRSDWLFLRLVD